MIPVAHGKETVGIVKKICEGSSERDGGNKSKDNFQN